MVGDSEVMRKRNSETGNAGPWTAWIAAGIQSAQEAARLPKFRGRRLNAMKRLWNVVLAAGTVVVLGPAPGVFGQNDASRPDLLEIRASQLAGPNAVDCGRVAPRGDTKKATDCALAANKAGKPFRVRYDLQGIDSYVGVAMVRLPDGTVEALSYDSDPMGGGGRAHEMVGVRKCPAPVQLYTSPQGRLTCFTGKPAGPRDAMSPTFDPY
jgi:hypothetical protein